MVSSKGNVGGLTGAGQATAAVGAGVELPSWGHLLHARHMRLPYTTERFACDALTRSLSGWDCITGVRRLARALGNATARYSAGIGRLRRRGL